MRFISTKFHGVMDYVVGILLIAAPWLLNFNNGGPAQYVPMIVGAVIILMALFTNYEAGIVRSIPMGTHLSMDIIVGLFLAASPWIFGFADVVYLPHLVVGIIEVAFGLMTETHSHTEAGYTTGHAGNIRHAH